MIPTSLNLENPFFLVNADNYACGLVNNNGLFQRGYRFLTGCNDSLCKADRLFTALDIVCMALALPLLSLLGFCALSQLAPIYGLAPKDAVLWTASGLASLAGLYVCYRHSVNSYVHFVWSPIGRVCSYPLKNILSIAAWSALRLRNRWLQSTLPWLQSIWRPTPATPLT